jgi:uncharacterized protein YkwD
MARLTLLAATAVSAWIVIAAGNVNAAGSQFATHGTPLDLARHVRAQGCRGRAGTRVPLRYIGGLNEAALEMSHGAKLKSAIATSGYRDQQSVAVHVSGDAASLQQAMANQMCESLVNPSFTDLGIAQRGRDTWMIIAVPFSPPAAANANAADAEVLRLINAARAQSRRCGNKLFPATGPLQANAMLRAAAEAHARDMLDHNYFEHQGHDGSTPAQRVAAAGYAYRVVGENLASGPETPAEAVEGWIASPDHCENLMDARFSESGVAFAATTYGPARVYWVQEFGTPR